MVLIGYLLSMLVGIVPLHGTSVLQVTNGQDQPVGIWHITNTERPAEQWQMPEPVASGLVLPFLLTEPELETGGDTSHPDGQPDAFWAAQFTIPPHRRPPSALLACTRLHATFPVARFIRYEAFLN